MVYVVKRLCGLVFISSLFIFVYQNNGVDFRQSENDAINQNDLSSHTLR